MKFLSKSVSLYHPLGPSKVVGHQNNPSKPLNTVATPDRGFPKSGPRDGYVHPTMINPQVSAVRISKDEDVKISLEQ